jgi:hypothetical protein
MNNSVRRNKSLCAPVKRERLVLGNSRAPAMAEKA